jgi:hypothetical protein
VGAAPRGSAGDDPGPGSTLMPEPEMGSVNAASISRRERPFQDFDNTHAPI